VVDYRGPQFLKSFCNRWNIDLYDRIIEVHLTERPTAINDLAALQSLQLATFLESTSNFNLLDST
jgi:hypothetical protein